MHRPTLGWIAIALLAASVALTLTGSESTFLRDGSARAGVVLGLVWLALPQLSGLPRSSLWGIAIAGAVVVWRPKLLLLVVPALVVMWLLRPRRRGR
jgi:hypothetical protein